MKALIDFEKPARRPPCTAWRFGGGTTMLAHCDFVYAAEGARFQLPFRQPGARPRIWQQLSFFRCVADISTRPS